LKNTTKQGDVKQQVGVDVDRGWGKFGVLGLVWLVFSRLVLRYPVQGAASTNSSAYA
jgi:hypothetical protein